MYFTIYKTTNLVNGNIYIGSHATKNLDDNYLGSGSSLHDAIKIYGRENFQREYLFFCENADSMFDKEAVLVTKDFCKRKDVYNQKPGGRGGHPLIWINKEQSNIRILEEQLPEYESEGWSRGRHKGKFMSGRVYINNGETTKAVSPTELDKFYREGWVKGRLKGNQSGKKHIYKDKTNKMVYAYELDDYISKGWKIGQYQS